MRHTLPYLNAMMITLGWKGVRGVEGVEGVERRLKGTWKQEARQRPKKMSEQDLVHAIV